MPKIFGIIFIIFISLIETSFAEKKIAFIDIDMIINESEFGKKSYKKIDDDFKKENEELDWLICQVAQRTSASDPNYFEVIKFFQKGNPGYYRNVDYDRC